MLQLPLEGASGQGLSRKEVGVSRFGVRNGLDGPGKLDGRSGGAGPMATMAKVPKSETVVVKVEIGGRKGVQTMIDSGADFTMWRRRGVPAGILVEAQEWEGGPLALAQNDVMWPEGQVECAVTFEGMEKVLEKIAIVESAPFELILGNDWLKVMDAMVGYRGGKKGVLIGPELFVPESGESGVRRIRLEGLAVHAEAAEDLGGRRDPAENEAAETVGVEGTGGIETDSSPVDHLVGIKRIFEEVMEVPLRREVAQAGEGGSKVAAMVVSEPESYNIYPRLTEKEKTELCELLKAHQRCFSSDMEETLCRSVVGFEHVIETGHHRPVRSLPRRLAPAERETVQLEVEEIMKAGVIEPSYSPWASPVVLVKKKDGGSAFV